MLEFNPYFISSSHLNKEHVQPPDYHTCIVADYNSYTFENDISLLKIAGSVAYTDYIIPICLPSEAAAVGDLCWVTGWGATEGTYDCLSIINYIMDISLMLSMFISLV